jgi:hypothetical protein
VLNHLDLSAHHDVIARHLGVHYLHADPVLFEANRLVLKEHQEAVQRASLGQPIQIGSFAANARTPRPESAEAAEWAITRLCENSRKCGRDLTADEVRKELGAYATAAQLELHPSDRSPVDGLVSFWDTAGNPENCGPPSRPPRMWQPLLVCPNLAGWPVTKCYSSCYSLIRVLGTFRVG